eukprot:3252596-Pyramimonas_sp.AAC.1
MMTPLPRLAPVLGICIGVSVRGGGGVEEIEGVGEGVGELGSEAYFSLEALRCQPVLVQDEGDGSIEVQLVKEVPARNAGCCERGAARQHDCLG